MKLPVLQLSTLWSRPDHTKIRPQPFRDWLVILIIGAVGLVMVLGLHFITWRWLEVWIATEPDDTTRAPITDVEVQEIEVWISARAREHERWQITAPTVVDPS